MQYFKPNANEFVMGPKDFDAFVKAFGREDIKITKKFSEDIVETTSAGSVAAVSMGVGPVLSRQPKNSDGTAKNALDMVSNKKKPKSKKA